ncbi:hypothetical protein ACQQ2Q_02290 [Agrobacterium sp. ES01]|uniref:hypothetical protein n=1 Tax=Agrobacterium sp. ES01 TaxID=3420714 RepID=UPI003D0CCFAD
MTRYILSAAFSMLATTAFAADTEPTVTHNACSGHAEAYIGRLYSFNIGNLGDVHTYGGATRANCNIEGNWNVQGDFVVDRLAADGAGYTQYGGTAHLFWRDPSSFAAGIFVSVNRTDIETVDWTVYSGGPQFQVYLDQVTLFGQAEYGQFDIQGNSVDFLGARGVARYFATPNLRFDTEIAYRDYDPLPIDVFYAAAQANYRFDDTPYTVFARYHYENISAGGNDQDFQRITAGLRISFGSGTLLDEDRHGAAMDTYRSSLISGGF